MSVPIEVSIELPGVELTAARRDELETAAASYAHSLVHDLMLPARPLVTVADLPAEPVVPAGLRMQIDGRPCRVGPWARSSPADVPADLDARIAWNLLQNRRSFITPAVLRALRDAKDFHGTALSRLSDDDRASVVGLLCDRLFGLGKCLSSSALAGTTPAGPQRFFERLIEDVRTPRVEVYCHDRFAAELDAAIEGGLQEKSGMMQDGLFHELGIAFPAIAWTTQPQLAEDEFVIRINDVALPTTRGLPPGRCLVNDTPDRLSLLNIDAAPATNPANGAAAATVADADAAVCEQAGLTTWDPAGFMILHISAQLRRHAGSFLTVATVEYALGKLSEFVPALVAAARARHDACEITWILRDLLDGDLSIRDLPGILDRLAIVNGTVTADLSDRIVLPAEGNHLLFTAGGPARAHEFPVELYADHVRQAALRRYISHRYTRQRSTLVVHLLDRGLERRLQQARDQPLTDDEHAALLHGVLEATGELPPVGPAVVLTAAESRRELQRLIRTEFPHVTAISYTELSSDLNVQPIGRIEWAEPPGVVT